MIPFRVFDRENRQMWVVLNHHPGDQNGTYLIATESDDDKDGSLKIVSAEDVANCRMVDFLDDGVLGE
jgi:hypothetical protein